MNVYGVLIFIVSSVASESENYYLLMNVNQSLYILNIPISWFCGDYKYKLLTIFVSQDLIQQQKKFVMVIT